MIGVTGAQLHRYETGVTPMAMGRVTALAEALGVRPDGLAGYSLPPTPQLTATMMAARLSDDLLALVEAFSRITDANSRSAVVAIARILAVPSQPNTSDKGNG